MQLRYQLAYHVHHELTMAGGDVVSLHGLDQTLTYGGLIEGVPNASLNDRAVSDALRRASLAAPAAAHLIKPERRSYFREPGDSRPGPFGPAEWLPSVECIGEFQASPLSSGSDASILRVVWYQDEFALPIDGAVLQQIERLPWRELAHDIRF